MSPLRVGAYSQEIGLKSQGVIAASVVVGCGGMTFVSLDAGIPVLLEVIESALRFHHSFRTPFRGRESQRKWPVGFSSELVGSTKRDGLN